MLIWRQGAGECGSVAALNLSWTPRTTTQLRLLVALYMGRALRRADVDWVAGVANGPALVASLNAAGFPVARRGDPDPCALVWSNDRSWAHQVGQYQLSPLGYKVLRILRSPAASFQWHVGGFESFADAWSRRSQLFGRDQVEVVAHIIAGRNLVVTYAD